MHLRGAKKGPSDRRGRNLRRAEARDRSLSLTSSLARTDINVTRWEKFSFAQSPCQNAQSLKLALIYGMPLAIRAI